MEQSEKEIEISKEEVAQAVAQYIAGETGVSEKVEPEEAGTRGAFVANVTEIAKDYAEGNISLEDAEKKLVEEAVSYSIAPVWEKVADKGVDVFVKVVSKLIPKRFEIVATLLEATKPFIKKIVKSKLVEKSVEFAYNTWNKVKVKTKEWIKKKLG